MCLPTQRDGVATEGHNTSFARRPATLHIEGPVSLQIKVASLGKFRSKIPFALRPASKDTLSRENCAPVGIPCTLPGTVPGSTALASLSMFFVQVEASYEDAHEVAAPSQDIPTCAPKHLPFQECGPRISLLHRVILPPQCCLELQSCVQRHSCLLWLKKRAGVATMVAAHHIPFDVPV